MDNSSGAGSPIRSGAMSPAQPQMSAGAVPPLRLSLPATSGTRGLAGSTKQPINGETHSPLYVTPVHPSLSNNDAPSAPDLKEDALQKELDRILEENQSVQQEIAIAQRIVARLERERDILLDQLMETAPCTADLDALMEGQQASPTETSVLVEEALVNRVLARLNNHFDAPLVPKKKRRLPRPGEDADKENAPHCPSSQIDSDLDLQKRRKSNKASSSDAVLKVQSVPMDEDNRPVMPLSLGILTVHCLGCVVSDRPAYHNRRYILPVGFHSSRPYLSVWDANATVVYHSRILDHGSAPVFEVTCEEHPDCKFTSGTSTGAWSGIVKQANAIRHRDYSNSASGPDYYGLSNATVSMLIERLPNADYCPNYQFKRFEFPPSVPATADNP